MRLLIAAFSVAVLAAGCATNNPRLPDLKAVSIAVSSEVDFDAVPPGAHLIPESQVLVAGKDGGAAIGSAFGLLGLGIGTAIDRSRNASALRDAAKALAVKFDRPLLDALVELMRTERGAGVKLVRASDRQAQVLLVPFAQFLAPADAPPLLSFHIVAQMGELTRSGYSDRKQYYYLSSERRAFSGAAGWGDAEGAAFKAAAAVAFRRLTDLFMMDLRGELAAPAGEDTRRRVKWQGLNFKGEAQVFKGMVVFENADYVAVAPVFRDVASRTGLAIVDRALLRD